MSKLVKSFLKRHKDENKSATTPPGSANKTPDDSSKRMRKDSPAVRAAIEGPASQRSSVTGTSGAYNDPTHGDVTTPAPPIGLTSSRADTRFKPDTFDPEKQKDLLDMAITAIGLCQTIGDVLPKGVDSVLQNVVKLLGVLKVSPSGKGSRRELRSYRF
jgi:hypothetical protein